MNIGIVGITGLVGKKIIELLERRNFPVKNLIPVASEKSYGKYINFKNNNYKIQSIEDLFDKEVDIVFMACSSEISKKYCKKLTDNNIWVIDNSSAFRMEEDIPLIIPEINIEKITKQTKLIANPNCSTAQLAMILYPLHKEYCIKRVVVSTYQSVSGAGYDGINQLNNERLINCSIDNIENNFNKVFKKNIDLNCIALCDDLDIESNYTKEEIKLENETPKIMDTDIKITATAVRVPVIGGHSESVNIEFEKEYDINKIKLLLQNSSGIVVKDICYPIDVKDKFDVYVGRIRRDYSRNNCINLWIVADNLMKGAALNAVQIAEYINNIFINT